MLLNYVGSFSCVIAVLLLCKMIGKLPVISFCGRYSIIILCLHHLIYRPVKLGLNHYEIVGQTGATVTAIITLAVCIGLIPLSRKCIPYFTAQKDLIKIKKKHSPREAGSMGEALNEGAPRADKTMEAG